MTNMHVIERDRIILKIVREQKFVSVRDLLHCVDASRPTLQRDLERLHNAGKLMRVRSGAKRVSGGEDSNEHQLWNDPFNEDSIVNRAAEDAIGKAAAELCRPGEAIIIDGSRTTLRMCPHLKYLRLHVLTNSLPILNALLQQPTTRISITAGAVLRERSIVIDSVEGANTARFHASKMFLGATAFTCNGPTKSDIALVETEKKLLSQADELIVLVESRKFASSAGYLLCELAKVHALITDNDVRDEYAKMIEDHGIKLITVEVRNASRLAGRPHLSHRTDYIQNRT